jgi:hypothetical protein
MHYQITVRYGGARQRYHTYVVEAEGGANALTEAARQMPPEISSETDLVELRVVVDPDARSYLDEGKEEEV